MSNALQLQITANNTALASLAQTKAAVVELSSVANRQIGGLQGLGGALQRLERREPATALRSVRMAVEEMALSATGTAGPVGRMAANFGLLATGTATGGALLVGLAAAGVAFKALTADVDATNERITEAIANVAKLAQLPASAQARLTLLQGRSAISELKDLGPLATAKRELNYGEQALALLELVSGTSSYTTGAPGNMETVAIVRREDEATRALNDARRADITLTEQSADALQSRLRLVTDASLGLSRARLGPHPTVTQTEALARQQDHETLAARHELTQAERDTIEQLHAETRARDRLNARLLEGERNFDRVFGKLTGVPLLRPGHPTAGFLGAGPDTQGIAQFHLENGQLVPGPRGPDVFAQMGAGASPSYARGAIDDFGKSVGEKSGAAIARTVAAMIPTLASAVQRGDTGGAVSALGGTLEGLSNVRNSAGKAVLGGLGPLGLAFSFGGELLSLFKGGGAKVSVMGLEQQALAQMKSLRGEPATVQVYVVGADGNVKQQLWAMQHATRTDANVRVPQP